MSLKADRRFYPLALAILLNLASTSIQAEDFLLKNVNLIDGTGKDPVLGTSILVRDGKISSLGPHLSSETAEMRDLEGRWVLPGLIDSHSHLATPDAARRALHSGTTTVRVLGTGYLQSLGTRDLIRQGYIEGPELLVSGGIVRPVLGKPFILAFPQFGRYLENPLSGPENVANVVETLLDRGVDVIKVGATERAGLASTDPRKPELTLEEIKAAVNTASARGVFVAAHAHGRKGAEAAVSAGVRSIEHGTYLSDESLNKMKESGIFLVPTLAVMSPRADPPGLSAEAVDIHIRVWHMQSALQEVVRKAQRLAIPIAASTDGSYGENDETAAIRVADDVEDLVHCGLSPMDAIVAATGTGAALLGIEERTGTIAVGKEADLIVLDRDPLKDLRALFDPLIVVTNGEVVLDRIY